MTLILILFLGTTAKKLLIIVMLLCSNTFASIKKMSKFYLRQIIPLKQAVHSESWLLKSNIV